MIAQMQANAAQASSHHSNLLRVLSARRIVVAAVASRGSKKLTTGVYISIVAAIKERKHESTHCAIEGW